MFTSSELKTIKLTPAYLAKYTGVSFAIGAVGGIVLFVPMLLS